MFSPSVWMAACSSCSCAMSILVPSLTRHVALDTEVVEATRQEYVLFLRAADGKITSIRNMRRRWQGDRLRLLRSPCFRGIDDEEARGLKHLTLSLTQIVDGDLAMRMWVRHMVLLGRAYLRGVLKSCAPILQRIANSSLFEQMPRSLARLSASE